jgi:single-stranded DNA-binding protein
VSILRLSFAGQIKKAEHRDAGGTPLVEVSICKKNQGKKGEDTFTWVDINVWKPADFQTAKLVKGNFIAGTGEMTMRSYVDKGGTKGHSIEVRCTSFDVEVSDGAQQEAPAPRQSAPQRPVKPDHAAAVAGDLEIPF